jgi:hypothetical protein
MLRHAAEYNMFANSVGFSQAGSLLDDRVTADFTAVANHNVRFDVAKRANDNILPKYSFFTDQGMRVNLLQSETSARLERLDGFFAGRLSTFGTHVSMCQASC